MLCLSFISATFVLFVLAGRLLVWLFHVTVTFVIIVVPIRPRFLFISATSIFAVFLGWLFVRLLLVLIKKFNI